MITERLKWCPGCGPTRGPIPESEFHPHGSTKDRLQFECKKCHNARRQKARKEKTGFYANEKERYHDSHLVACRESYYKAKQAVFDHYGRKCVWCGFDDPRALSIDHKDSDGADHRRKLGGVNFYRWLVRQKFPDNFQVLCMNCQFIKRHDNHEFKPYLLPPEPSEFRA